MPRRAPDPEALALKFTKELNSGTVALMLLGLLAGAGRAMYGYEIVRELEGRGGPAIKQGTLYPALRALERQGLLASRTAASAAGPPRRYYRVSAAGRRALASWSRIWRATRDAVEECLPPAARRGRDEGSGRRVS